jgi:hypothetical protein
MRPWRRERKEKERKRKKKQQAELTAIVGCMLRRKLKHAPNMRRIVVVMRPAPVQSGYGMIFSNAVLLLLLQSA